MDGSREVEVILHRHDPSVGQHIIRGVKLLAQRVHSDARGDLVAFEHFGGPFEIKRVFTIVAGALAKRGGHANSCHELITAVCGKVAVHVDNGAQHSTICLSSPSNSLWVRPGIVIDLMDFAPRTVLMVGASETYEETRHYNCAQPDLICGVVV